MAMMEIDSNLKKNWVNFFKFIALRLLKFAKTLILIYSLFENSLDIFLLKFYKHFVSDKGSWI